MNSSAPLEFRAFDTNSKKFIQFFVIRADGVAIFNAVEAPPEGGPKVISQYIGKKDSQGYKEFGGDILKLKVQNEFGSFQTLYTHIYYDEASASFLLQDESIINFKTVVEEEIVGNIFEYPDYRSLVKPNEIPEFEIRKPYPDN